MNHFQRVATLPATSSSAPGRARCLALALLVALAGCADQDQEAKPGQALASVNGEEITVLQLNEELQRAGVAAAQQEAASKRLLQVLIDRQLLQHEAARENLDRDPKVMQAVERAKALIVAQAYLQKRVGNVARPTTAEVEDYFTKNPHFFAKRKQFILNELIIASRDLTPEVKAAADGAASLEEVATWLDARKIRYARAQVTRSTSDLNPQLSEKLLAMDKGQLFIIREGERAMLLSLAEVKEAPVTLQVASQQIEQFLMNRKSQEVAAAELARLRTGAKIEYLNKALARDPALPPAAVAPAAGGSAQPPASTGAPAPAAAAPASAASSSGSDKAAFERGVAGLK